MALIFEAKVALFEALKGLVPAGTQCSFADTGKADRRSQVWLGETTDEDLEPVAMRAGPRKPTAVTGYVEAHALVVSPGGPMAAERAVYELRDSIADACRSIDRVAIPGLLDIRPESASVDSAETTDGAYSALTVRVRVRGRVT
ncbi:hypothetical protein OHA38_20460 [Streptomyces sp. NBC_01732]|uniref:hypothetical protein n=1 Tax=Streptomyces sp. NBC_01732 TaxID=2975926 RepID=UPI00352FB41C|nr:hypothetical protein OHA38_20460 [Streptomyces sp. NBC_01732]